MDGKRIKTQGLTAEGLTQLIDLIKRANSEQLQNISDLAIATKRKIDSEELVEIKTRDTILQY